MSGAPSTQGVEAGQGKGGAGRPAVPASESKPGGGSSGQGEEKLRDQRKVEPPKANVGKGSCGVCEDTYDIIEPIGGGTYGDVFKARAKADGPNAEIVALKRLKMDEKTEGEGMPITAIREIHILRQLEHENIVRLIEVAVSDPRSLEPGMIYMVFEYMEHDLTGMLSNMIARLTSPEVKSILKQLLTGLHYCHSHSVLHRDLKPANLLLSKDGVLKLADYGLARILSSNERRQYTNKVVTLWYRAPELLLGSRKYSAEIDVWSVGCIFAEILSASAQDAANTANVKQHKIGKPIFPGEKEEEQLNYIFYVLGYPTEKSWPGVSELPHFSKLKPTRQVPCGLSDWLKKMGYVTQDALAVDLLGKMLTLDPKKRISAIEALQHEYFWTDPMPCKPEELPKVRASMSKESHQKRMSAQQHHDGGANKGGAEQNKQPRGGAGVPQQGGPRNGRGPPGGISGKPRAQGGPGGPRGQGGYQHGRGHGGSAAPPGREVDPDSKRRRMDYGHEANRGREPPGGRRGDGYDGGRDSRAGSSDRNRGPAPNHSGSHYPAHHSSAQSAAGSHHYGGGDRYASGTDRQTSGREGYRGGPLPGGPAADLYAANRPPSRAPMGGTFGAARKGPPPPLYLPNGPDPDKDKKPVLPKPPSVPSWQSARR